MDNLTTGGIFGAFNSSAQNDQNHQSPGESETTGNIIGVFGTPHPPVEPEKTEVSAAAKGASEKDRKAYKAYREAVSNYNGLVAAKNRAVANAAAVKREHNKFPAQMKELVSARDDVILSRKKIEEERNKLEKGDASAKNQLRNIQCDGQISSLVRSARDNGWMTPEQQEYVQKNPEEVCENTIKTVDKLEALENSFKQTSVYDHLVNGTVDPAMVTKANTQFLLILTGILTVLCLLTRLTQWGVLVTVINWGIGLFIIGNIVYTVFRAKALTGVMRLVAIGSSALASLGIVSMIMDTIAAGPWGAVILLSLLVNAVFSLIFMRRIGNQIALPVLEKLGLMKNSAHRETFVNAASVAEINDMLYAYCNHDAVMDYMRANARKIWVRQLDAKLAEIDAALAKGEAAVGDLKQQEAQHQKQIAQAEAQVSVAQMAIQKAELDIRTWNGTPDLEMAGSKLADHICVESGESGKFEILNHNKKPMVISYRGNPHALSQIDQVEDKMAAVVKAFSKMNPSALIQVSLIAADSGYLRSGPVFQVSNDTAEKYFISGQGDGSIYLVSSASDVMKYQKVFERRIDDLGEFINMRRDQLQGDHIFEKVNELRTANQLPYRYQILLILVPRASDPDILRDSSLRSYLKNLRAAQTNGIIPVLFVDKSSIHENWKSIVTYYQEMK